MQKVNLAFEDFRAQIGLRVPALTRELPADKRGGADTGKAYKKSRPRPLDRLSDVPFCSSQALPATWRTSMQGEDVLPPMRFAELGMKRFRRFKEERRGTGEGKRRNEKRLLRNRAQPDIACDVRSGEGGGGKDFCCKVDFKNQVLVVFRCCTADAR